MTTAFGILLWIFLLALGVVSLCLFAVFLVYPMVERKNMQDGEEEEYRGKAGFCLVLLVSVGIVCFLLSQCQLAVGNG